MPLFTELIWSIYSQSALMFTGRFKNKRILYTFTDRIDHIVKSDILSPTAQRRRAAILPSMRTIEDAGTCAKPSSRLADHIVPDRMAVAVHPSL